MERALILLTIWITSLSVLVRDRSSGASYRKKIPSYCWSYDRSYKKSIDNSTHFFWSDEEVDRVIVGVFGRVMVKSSFQFYRMILLTRHFPKNNSIEFKNPGRDRKLESMEYFSFETQKDGNVISESGGADTVLSYLNFQTPRAIDSPRERDTPNKH